MADLMEIIGKRLKLARENRGMSLRELAEAAGGYVPNMSSYEKGRRLPSLELFIRMACTLGVSVDFLLGGDNEEGVLLDEELRESLKKILSLAPRDRKMVLEIIDVFDRRKYHQSMAEATSSS